MQAVMPIRALLNRLKSKRIDRFFFSLSEVRTIWALRKRFVARRSFKDGAPLNVVVDGFLPLTWVSFYYILLLLVLGNKSNREVKVILLCPNRRACYWTASRIYRYFFATSYICVDSYLSDEQFLREKTNSNLSHRALDVIGDLIEMKYDGVEVGKDAYYGFIRSKQTGTIIELSDEVREIADVVIRNCIVADKLIASFSPDLLLVTHSGYETFGPYVRVFLKRGVPVALTSQYGKSPERVFGRSYVGLSDFIGAKRRHAISFDDETWSEIRTSYGSKEDKLVDEYLNVRFAGNDKMFDGNFHKNTIRVQDQEIRHRLGIEDSDSRKVVLVATHFLWDDPGYDGLYHDYETWLEDTLRTIAQNSEVLWIIKAHPSERHYGTNRYVRDIFAEVFGDSCKDHIRFIDTDTDLNTYSLIDFSEAVLTVRGTIGFEAACRGRHVITAGYGPFSGLGFAAEFGTREEYRAYLLNIQNIDTEMTPQKMHSARMGLYGYFVKKAPDARVFLRGKNLSCYADMTAAELYAEPTLTRFAEKLLSGKGGDLL